MAIQLMLVYSLVAIRAQSFLVTKNISFSVDTIKRDDGRMVIQLMLVYSLVEIRAQSFPHKVFLVTNFFFCR